jgi:hypothetical protein
MKNWVNDSRFGCTNGPKSIEEHMDVDSDMVSKNENLIRKFYLFEED